MPRRPALALFVAALSALPAAAGPGDAVTAVTTARGTVSQNGTSLGAFTATPTMISFQGQTMTAAADPPGAVIFYSALQIPAAVVGPGVADGTYQVTTGDGVYWLDHPGGSERVAGPDGATLGYAVTVPDTRLATADYTYGLQREEGVTGSAKFTRSTDPGTGGMTVKYTGGFAGTDPASGLAASFTLSGVLTYHADGQGAYSQSVAVRVGTASDAFSYLMAMKESGTVSFVQPTPEPVALGAVAVAGCGLLAGRHRRRRSAAADFRPGPPAR